MRYHSIQQTIKAEQESMLGTTRHACPKKVVIIIGRKCQVSDQDLVVCDMYVMGLPSVWVSPLIITVVFTWADVNFVSAISVRDWNSGVWHHCSQPEKVMIRLATALSSACHSEYCVGLKHLHVAFGMSWRNSVEFAMNNKLPRICPLLSVVTITWCSWYFAAMPLGLCYKSDEYQ